MVDKLLTFGVWDLLHKGHVRFLDNCKNMCEELIVGIQSDDSVLKQKGNKPVINEVDRKTMLEQLSIVSKCFIYDDMDYAKYLRKYKCDGTALSLTHENSDRFDCLKIKPMYYFPYDNTVSSSQIKDQISGQWSVIWDRVAGELSDDYEIVGHDEGDTFSLARYIESKLKFGLFSTVVDYGCGTGVLLKELRCDKIGIDCSRNMLNRAMANEPDAIYILSDKPCVYYPDAYFYSWGVFHYLQSLELAHKYILDIKGNYKGVLLMELPDAAKRSDRLDHRIKLGKKIDPEPLYFDKQWFIDNGFTVYDTELKISDNSDYSFTALYIDPSHNI